MIAPTRTLVSLLVLPAVCSAILLIYPAAWPALAAIDAFILLLMLVDLFSLPRMSQFRSLREMNPIATRGQRHPVCIVLENRSARNVHATVRDDNSDPAWEPTPEIPVELPSHSRVQIEYDLVPPQRGSFSLEHVYLRVRSRWELWSRILSLPVPGKFKVFPALKEIERYGVLAKLNRMSLLGVRKQRRVGTDNEFERLRDYASDDQFRSIDWRATARRLKLTVRDHQRNQSQRIIFVIDCGRLMVNQSVHGSMLDSAFDAALMLANVTLSQKDEVGLVCFSDRILRWLPPKPGRSQLNRMVHAVHDLFPEFAHSRFDQAFLHLKQNCRKRALVIFISNLIDDYSAEQFKVHARSLVGRHLPLTVLLRDHDLFDPATNIGPLPPTSQLSDTNLSEVDFYTAAAASEILTWRRQVLTDLRHQGILTLDVFPENMSAPLINEYLRIKAQHLL